MKKTPFLLLGGLLLTAALTQACKNAPDTGNPKTAPTLRWENATLMLSQQGDTTRAALQAGQTASLSWEKPKWTLSKGIDLPDTAHTGTVLGEKPVFTLDTLGVLKANENIRIDMNAFTHLLVAVSKTGLIVYKPCEKPVDILKTLSESTKANFLDIWIETDSNGFRDVVVDGGLGTIVIEDNILPPALTAARGPGGFPDFRTQPGWASRYLQQAAGTVHLPRALASSGGNQKYYPTSQTFTAGDLTCTWPLSGLNVFTCNGILYIVPETGEPCKIPLQDCHMRLRKDAEQFSLQPADDCDASLITCCK